MYYSLDNLSLLWKERYGPIVRPTRWNRNRWNDICILYLYQYTVIAVGKINKLVKIYF